MGGGDLDDLDDLDDGLEEAIERLLEGLAALEASLGGQEEDLTIDPPLPDLVALSHTPQPSIDRVTISMLAQSHGDAVERRFVQFRVRVDWDPTDVTVDVVDNKGLDDATEASIRQRLVQCLEESDGDLMTVMFLALELADEYNRPHGMCSICREEFCNDADVGSILRLNCFHCFHAYCFWPWFDWKQRQLAEKVAELEREQNGNVNLLREAMKTAGIEAVVRDGRDGRDDRDGRDIDTEYVLQCPNCRERLGWLPGRKDAAAPRPTEVVVSLGDLSEEVRRKVKALQIRQGEGLERQARCGGIAG